MVYHYLGVAYFRQEKPAEAMKFFKLAVAKKEDQYVTYSYLEQIAQKEKKFALAREYLALYNKHKKNKSAYFQEMLQGATQTIKQKDYNRCISQCNEIILQFPRSAQAYTLRGQARLQRMFERSAPLSNKAPAALWARRQAFSIRLLRIGLDFAHGAQIQPENLQVFLGQYGQVIKSYYRLLSEKEIHRLLISPLNDFPMEAEVYFLKGVFYFLLLEMGLAPSFRISHAIQSLREALKIKRSFAAAWSVLGYFYLYRNRMARAKEALERATKLSPKLGVNHYFMACYYGRKKEIPQAISHLHQALDHGFQHHERIQSHPFLEAVREAKDWKVLETRWKNKD